jgi:hypothetical protein
MAGIGGMMWQGERVYRISREEHERRQLEKWYGDKRRKTWKARLRGKIAGHKGGTGSCPQMELEECAV